MTDYDNFPPKDYLDIVLRQCPASAHLYTKLWENRDEHGENMIDKTQIRNHFLISPTLFRNLCLPLVGSGLISIRETPKYFIVEMVDFDHDSDR